MPQQEWFYAEGNQRRGPVEAEAIPRLIASGTIQADTLVWTAGMDQWAVARDTIPPELYPPEPDDGTGAPPLPSQFSGRHPETMQDAVKTVFSKFGVIEGRARRPEYWWFFLFSMIVSLSLSFIEVLVLGPDSIVFSLLWSVIVLVPSITVGVRRLHDIGRSGWWFLIAFIPIIGTIVLIVWFATPGEEGPNQYGPR